MPVSFVNSIQPHLNTQLSTPHSSSATRNAVLASHKRADQPRLTSLTTKRAQLDQAKSTTNSTAKHIRSMDAKLQALEHHVRRMYSDYRAFKKNFPPFPQGSEDRVRLLSSFQAIRKQIERLTIPPREEMVVSNNNEVVAAQENNDFAIDRFQQFLNMIGSSIPNLTADTPDAVVSEIPEKLERVHELLIQKRSELAEQAVAKKYYIDSTESAVMIEMETISLTLGGWFADEADWQISMSQTQLKALLV